MRKSICINQNWTFHSHSGEAESVNIPHTWNAIDGADGGNDYWRGSCTYETVFTAPDFNPGQEVVYLEFRGVNATADVVLNDTAVMHHDGGYSTFRADITSLLKQHNRLTVKVDNSVNDKVYPQKADFTFYGGIYRDVVLLTVNKHHFDLDYFGGSGLCITSTVSDRTGRVRVQSWTNTENPQVKICLKDAMGNEVAHGSGTDTVLEIPDVHLWDGREDPYLYTAELSLIEDGRETDRITSTFGVRSFHMDPREGFFLNGRSYPLHGVSRHQDRKGLGNALTTEHHDEDMNLIREIGANTIRLAHYQHDQYFYDLCDRYGMIVWAEIPYISEHMPNGRDNTISQMKELIVQNYNHPSIVTWGLSNEITISTKDKKDRLDNHRMLNDLCHEMDNTRPTSLACYAMCGPFNKSAHISDLVSWNLYLGWYVPGLFLNDWWIGFFHKVFPNRCLGYSEYGCEGMPNLHSSKPRRGDHTEEYQAQYHEFLSQCFTRHPYMWSTHVWNMFDFAADARNQGGEPGMNHKGLITFDRKTKKDSFYLYKAWWSKEPFVHICSKRFEQRTEQVITIRVYSNLKKVELYVDGERFAEQTGEHVFVFKNVPLHEETKIKVTAGDETDETVFYKTDKPNPSYKLQAKSSNSANWV